MIVNEDDFSKIKSEINSMYIVALTFYILLILTGGWLILTYCVICKDKKLDPE